MNLLFLDIDGVLNDHSRNQAGKYYLQQDKVGHANLILDSIPDLQIVLSSSWRMEVWKGNMSLKGMEYLLTTHGLKVENRLHGVTLPKDEEGHEDRTRLILRYVDSHKPNAWVAIDDRPLVLERNINTDGKGLTWNQATLAVYLLTEENIRSTPQFHHLDMSVLPDHLTSGLYQPG